MKKFFHVIAILCLLAGLADSLKAQPQYYNYSTSGSANSFPLNMPAGKEVQLLYLPGDFNQPTAAPAGNIVSIALRINDGYALGPWTYTDFTIKMGQSAITGFTAGSFYPGTLTTVYYRASVLLSAAAGSWMTIVFDTPFTYDPTQSLIVDIGQCGAVGATGFSASFTSLTGNRRIWSVGGCPFVVYATPNTAVYHMGLNFGAAAGPTVVTTAATGVTALTASLNGTVNANGSSTAVTFEYGPTTTYGTIVPGVPATVTGSTVTAVTAAIAGLSPNTLYHFRIKGTNANGSANGADLTFTTSLAPPVVVTNPATNISGPLAQLNGTVTANNSSTAVSFDWGLTMAYGNNVAATPSPVTGNTPTAVLANIVGLTPGLTYNFRCVGINAGGTTNGLNQSFVAGCQLPAAAGVIAGSNSVCANSAGKVYSIGAIANATAYIWTVPAGAIITAGPGTTSITVTFGTTSGNVTVMGTNTCGNGTPASLPVAVNALPLITIAGASSLCMNSGDYTYTTQGGFTNYVWTVSPGGTITNGQGTNQLQVSWNQAGAQWVAVNYNTLAGCSAPAPTQFPITVIPLPGNAVYIYGPTSACAGSQGIAYSTPAIPNALSYVWTCLLYTSPSPRDRTRSRMPSSA